MLFTVSPLMALGDVSNPLSVDMTPVSNTKFSQGEPVVFHYTIRNMTAQIANISIGAADSVDWLKTRLVDSHGQSVSGRAGLQKIDRKGLHFSAALLDPHGTQEGYLVASQWLTIPQPGSYILTFQVSLDYGLGDNAEDSAEALRSAPLVFAQEYIFPITVTAANPLRLEAVAKSLVEAATEATDPRQQIMLIQSLVSMPEAQAGSSWEALANNAVLRGDLASELAHVPSIRTADILARIAWAEPSQSAAASSEAGQRLSEMYNVSSGSLKQHIKELYAKHGIQLPDQILMLENG